MVATCAAQSSDSLPSLPVHAEGSATSESTKLCAKCGNTYLGFGNICPSCRRTVKVAAVPMQCAACRGWHLGPGELCEDCKKKTLAASEDPEGAVKLLRYSQGKGPAAKLLAVMVDKDLEKSDDIVHAGGIPPLVRLLVGMDGNAKEAATKVLNVLADNKEHRKMLGEAASIDEFLGVLRGADEMDVKEMAARGLKVSAVEPKNKQAIVNADGHVFLVELLKTWTGEAQAIVAWTLNNISIGSSDRKMALARAGSIPMLVRVLQGGSDEGRIASAATLQNLAVMPNLRDQIVDAGAIPSLVELLQMPLEPGQQKACDALRNLSLGSQARAAAVAKPENIEALVKVWEVGGKQSKKAAVDLLRDLAASSPSRMQAVRAAASSARAAGRQVGDLLKTPDK